jgi:hypothetical protein
MEESNPVGRPTKYREEYADQVYKLALLGLTLEEMATFFEVSVSTVSLWKVEHPKFSEAIARGGTPADAEVAVSLRQRALGYSHPAVKIFMPAGSREPVIVDYVEHYPPDTHAAAMWLWNRQPGKWRKSRDNMPGDDDGDETKITGGLPD